MADPRTPLTTKQKNALTEKAKAQRIKDLTQAMSEDKEIATAAAEFNPDEQDSVDAYRAALTNYYSGEDDAEETVNNELTDDEELTAVEKAEAIVNAYNTMAKEKKELTGSAGSAGSASGSTEERARKVSTTTSARSRSSSPAAKKKQKTKDESKKIDTTFLVDPKTNAPKKKEGQTTTEFRKETVALRKEFLLTAKKQSSTVTQIGQQGRYLGNIADDIVTVAMFFGKFPQEGLNVGGRRDGVLILMNQEKFKQVLNIYKQQITLKMKSFWQAKNIKTTPSLPPSSFTGQQFTRAKLTKEAINWVRSEDFNTVNLSKSMAKYRNFWANLAKASGVKTKEETALWRGYIQKITLDRLITIATKRPEFQIVRTEKEKKEHIAANKKRKDAGEPTVKVFGQTKYTPALLKNFGPGSSAATYTYVNLPKGKAEKVVNTTKDTVFEVITKKIRAKHAYDKEVAEETGKKFDSPPFSSKVLYTGYSKSILAVVTELDTALKPTDRAIVGKGSGAKDEDDRLIAETAFVEGYSVAFANLSEDEKKNVSE